MGGGTRRLETGTRATQASPPTSSATPAPTGTKALPKRHDKKPPPESIHPRPYGKTGFLAAGTCIQGKHFHQISSIASWRFPRGRRRSLECSGGNLRGHTRNDVRARWRAQLHADYALTPGESPAS